MSAPAQPGGLAEITLMVEDLATATRFYQEVVCLVPVREPSEKWAWFWAGEPGIQSLLALHRGSLMFQEHSPLGEEHRWGPVHFALNVGGEELQERLQRIRQAGLEVYGPHRWDGTASYYFFDPDANLVEYMAPDASIDAEDQ